MQYYHVIGNAVFLVVSIFAAGVYVGVENYPRVALWLIFAVLCGRALIYRMRTEGFLVVGSQLDGSKR